MKNIKLYIGIIIGVLISSVGVYALNINARDTAYDNTNSGSSATNMQDAIDDLYERSGNASLIDCGTYSGNVTINISNYYDGDLTNLTGDNFILEFLSSNAGTIGWGRTGKSTYSNSVSKTVSNGVLSISLPLKETIRYGEGAGLEWLSDTYEVWLVPNDFRN